MSVLTALRDRFSTRESSAVQADADGDPVAEAELPFDGYERLDAAEVKQQLSDHSQVELAAVEAYERSHKSREDVLDKLRYMRGREPLPDYDALSVEQITTALAEADKGALKKVRGYERKFANRPLVMDEVGRLHRERQAAEPDSPPPAYEPTSYDRTAEATETSDRA